MGIPIHMYILESIRIFSFFYVFQNNLFEKKIKAITMQLSVESSGKVLCVIWNRSPKTYSKFVTLRSFFKIVKKKIFKRTKIF